jgi:hypothetical protein
MRIVQKQPAAPAEASPNEGRTGNRSARIHTDVFVAGTIILLSALVWAGTLTFEEVPAALTQGMGAAIFPRLILGVLIVLGVLLAATCRGKDDPEREPVHRMVFLTAAAGLVFMAILQTLGIYGAILFSFIGIGRLWGERRWLLLVGVALGMAAATHLLFVTAFGIPLPGGLISQWLR